MFDGCTSLRDVNIQSAALYGDITFRCPNLQRITIGPAAIIQYDTDLGEYRFYDSDGYGMDITSPEFVGHTYVGTMSKMIQANPSIEHLVSYDANGGSDAPAGESIAEGSYHTVKPYSGQRSGYEFTGWSYKGVTYNAGDRLFISNESVILIAEWDGADPSGSDDVQLYVLIALIGVMLVIAVVYFYRMKR